LFYVLSDSAQWCWDDTRRRRRWYVKNVYLNMFLARLWDIFFLPRFCPPKVTERSFLRLFGVLGNSHIPPWVLNLHPWCYPILGFDEGQDLRIGGADAKGRHNWSFEQLQRNWEKACIFSLVSISSLSLLFVNLKFSTMESYLFVEIRWNELNSYVICVVNIYIYIYIYFFFFFFFFLVQVSI